jgi:acetoacetyl-CoA synthetase
MAEKTDPKLLWAPSDNSRKHANITSFINWLRTNKSLHFHDYQELWQWSTAEIEEFWQAILEYFEVQYDGTYSKVLDQPKMPGNSWFAGIKLNYAEHIFRHKNSSYPAIIFKSESSDTIEISWEELERQVAALQNFFISHGLKPDDRVAAYLPNIPEAIIAFLAVNSLGAIWSSTSPDFGTSSVVDRIAQIEPVFLIAADSYSYGGKKFSKTTAIQEIINTIPTIKSLILVNGKNDIPIANNVEVFSWQQATEKGAQIAFTRVDFNHPIWVLYSSGTTGIPKAITHSQGGVLLEHLKYLSFHNDIKPGDRCFWYTTIGWMMWNYIQASMLCGGTVVLYDGSPAYPYINTLWKFAEESKLNHFGTSAGFIVANMKAGIEPGKDYDLSNLRSIGSTGSPLPAEGFTWIYQKVKQDLWLASISGGTDVCSAFVGGNPIWPVYEGEIQCRALGCDLQAFNELGQPVDGEMGEMVIRQPMPSMPIFFWGDENYRRYRESYFEMFPDVWRHGDWTEITSRQGVIIYGRSDSTLNRGGIRIGTAEIYRAVDTILEIADSIIVFIDHDGKELMPLFVKMAPGRELTTNLIKQVKTTIRANFTPRHVPDQIIAVPDIPYTISGKKMETPLKKILMGMKIDEVINRDAMRNPEALDYFIKNRL